MIDRLNELSPGGKALLVAAIVVMAPLSGWLGYQLGLFLGSN